ncbi:MAG: diaminopropionate ammonia-lyase [Spirochaetes bacterium]|nr:diaminopropionate ammonia-lyase [Spirochaetota bacterium]
MRNKKPDIQWLIQKKGKKDVAVSEEMFPIEISKIARRFHRQIPGFKMSPLRGLSQLAQMLGVGGIWVKDEAVRLELNSFKVLGGSFAIYRFIQEKLGLKDGQMTYDYLISDEVRNKLGEITFASATDGNHGRGIAWAASKLRHKSMIYVHSETSQPRIDAIKSYGATVKVIDGNYDDAVRQIVVDAEKNGWEIVSDTSWEGYTTVPMWIMQGYSTMMAEIQEQFAAQGIIKPTHVFVQAGVGALAASVTGYYHSLFGQAAPQCIVVAPENAACLYHSAKQGDNRPHNVTGSLDTIMAGLACGEPSPIAWKILNNVVDCFVACPDYIAAKGMRIYATPLAGDPFIISGESGAVTLGALVAILKENGVEELRKFLNINEDSQILFINTEGNTDPVQFRQIIWEGANPVPPEYWTDLSR